MARNGKAKKISKNAAWRRIAQDFPGAELTLLQNFEAYVFETDTGWVIRFPKWMESQEKYRREAAFVTELEQGGFPVPIPHYEDSPADKAYVSYRKIPGEHLVPDVFAGLADDMRKRIADQLGAGLRTLHGLPLVDARMRGVPEASEDVIARALDELAELRRIRQHISEEQYCALETLCDDLTRLPRYERKCVTHNDICPEHLLLDSSQEGLLAIIDFADMEIQDPATDFGTLWSFGEPFVDATLAAYGRADPGLKDRSKLIFAGSRIHLLMRGYRKNNNVLLDLGRQIFALA